MNKKLPQPLVTVVIPCFNYSNVVRRAIDSVKEQTLNNLECFVVDNNSTDNSKEIILNVIKDDKRFHYLNCDKQGVAHTRNLGILNGTAPYICCLDADDAIDPRFLEVCIESLQKDRSLGIAYAGLRWIKPDGSTGISQWPGPADFDAQIKQRNQIPTCCVFRRFMWEALGGYRQRYADSKIGAGAEDAEFFLRAGAYGWGAKKATEEALFIYSWMSGRVSGQEGYVEPDWTAWHPWAGKKGDGQHPFASAATPQKYAHPVRQYDEPVISVIIPVGPGHDEVLIDALDSLEAQTFRKWEAIVINDTGKRFNEYLLKAYPHIRLIDSLKPIDMGWETQNGAGFSRNLGAGVARAPFLVFLDADDWLYPQALDAMLEAWKEGEAIIYTDYVGKAFVDNPEELAPDLQERVYQYQDGVAIIGYRAADFDHALAQRQPEPTGIPHMPYYQWSLITSLVPKSWHDEIGGFDEQMSSWEDIDYHWRMARAGKCYARIPQELMVYRFNTGQRRQIGLQSHQAIVEYIEKKYREIEIVSCNCGASRKRQVQVKTSDNQLIGLQMVAENKNGDNAMSDEDFLLCQYVHPNRGQHAVVGATTKTKYGFRGGGSTFLVHKQDIQAQPHLFIPQEQVAPPKIETPSTPPPDSISSVPLPGTLAAPKSVAVSEEGKFDPEAPVEVVIGFDLMTLPGMTAAIKKQFEADGIQTPADIKDLTEEQLMLYKGVGERKAEALLAAVKAIAA